MKLYPTFTCTCGCVFSTTYQLRIRFSKKFKNFQKLNWKLYFEDFQRFPINNYHLIINFLKTLLIDKIQGFLKSSKKGLKNHHKLSETLYTNFTF